MDDFIWAGIRAVVLSHAFKVVLAISVFLGWIAWGFMAAKWKANVFDKIKRESNLEALLDTAMKEQDKKMEGNTTYCYPQDEGPLTRICPLCGALYPSYKVLCDYDKQELQPFKKPITEPLTAIAKLNTLIQDINDAEQLFEQELEKVRYELEEKAYYYGNRKRPYSFTDQETLDIYNLYSKVKMQSHEGERAS